MSDHPVKTFHPEYSAMMTIWTRCRDAYAGSDAVKAKGQTYLPQLSGQSLEDYHAYKKRALFYAITAKTVGALVGLASAKPPTIRYPEKMKPLFEDFNGVQFHELVHRTLTELVLVGRIGVLVDRLITNELPQVVVYPAESIINWRTDAVGNPVLVVLKEDVLVPDELNEFKSESRTQYRVLSLVNGVYTQRVFDHKGVLTSEIQPTNVGLTMDYIPFYVVSPSGLGFGVKKPPILDVVDVNISHYLSSADLENGRHFAGIPTVVVSGVTPDTSAPIKIGGSNAIVLPPPEAKAYYLEFTGQGLATLERALAEKQTQMATIAARLMDVESRGSEAAETVRMRFLSETATLASMVGAVEAFVRRVYSTIAAMEGLQAKDLAIILNREFLVSKLSGKDLKEMVAAYQAGAISVETLVYNLRSGDLLSPDRDDEDEIKHILSRTTTADKSGVGGSKPVDHTSDHTGDPDPMHDDHHVNV